MRSRMVSTSPVALFLTADSEAAAAAALRTVEAFSRARPATTRARARLVKRWGWFGFERGVFITRIFGESVGVRPPDFSGWINPVPGLPVDRTAGKVPLIARVFKREAHASVYPGVDSGMSDRGWSSTAAYRKRRCEDRTRVHAWPSRCCGLETDRGRVPDRGLVYREERSPTGPGDGNRSQTARSSPQGAGAKGWEAHVRPKEHKWAVRQDVGGECATHREARASLTGCVRAYERKRVDSNGRQPRHRPSRAPASPAA